MKLSNYTFLVTCDLPKTFLLKKMPNDILRQIFSFLYSKKNVKSRYAEHRENDVLMLFSRRVMANSTEETDERRFASGSQHRATLPDERHGVDRSQQIALWQIALRQIATHPKF